MSHIYPNRGAEEEMAPVSSDHDFFPKKMLQRDLERLFAEYEVDVSIGLTKDGVAIRSQDLRVDALNIGAVTPYETKG